MIRRTTFEIDDELLARAKKALGAKSGRATIEKALRMAIGGAEAETAYRAEGQRRYLKSLAGRTDGDVLESDEMWR